MIPITFQAIGDLVDSVSTWNPIRETKSGAFRYIDLSAIDRDKKVITRVNEIDCSNAPSRARQIVKVGDVLVSTVRPNLNGVAKVPVELDSATASTGFCVLRPQPSLLDTNYLFHWVNSPPFVADMIKKATGASYPAVTDKIVLTSLIPYVPVMEQCRIASILDHADALRAKRREALAQLDTLAQAIFIEMFGDLITNPKGWSESLVLGDVADIASGVTKGRNVEGKETRAVPYLAVANVQDKKLNLSFVKEIDATEDEIRRYLLKTDDLLLTEGGDPDKLGRGTLWHDELPECIHQNHIFRVRLRDNKDLLPQYLNWLVGSPRGKRYFLSSAKQTTGIASINMTQLRRFPLLIPPIELQRKFVVLMSKIEKQNTLLLKSREEFDSLFASLQYRAFRGEL